MLCWTVRRGGGGQRRREGAEPRCGFYTCTCNLYCHSGETCTWDLYCHLVFICTWDLYCAVLVNVQMKTYWQY